MSLITSTTTAAGTETTASRLAVLLFTDIVGSTDLKSRLGAAAYARLLSRHDELFKQSLAGLPSVEVINDTGDGYLVAFATASDAVRFALRMQKGMHDEPWGANPLRVSIGVHLGEITEVADANGRPRVIGLAIDLAGRLTALATAGQILLTRTAFDEARQFLREYPTGVADASSPPLAGSKLASEIPLRWIAHGDYRFKGAAEPVEVFEVGGEGIAPLAPPPNNDNARRSVSADEEETLGWRPAVGLEVPQRVGWILEQRLGEGTFGEVWLARDEVTKRRSVFKFCFDLQRLHSFKREVTFFRLLRETLGERRDIAQLYDVRLDDPPYFLESEYAPGGNLHAWANAQGGLAKVPLATRLEIVEKVCDAVAAAHSVGILHKDIKPGNILVHVDADRTLRPQLADFGIGLLMDRKQLADHHITEIGMTGLDSEQSSRTGTRMYAPPESLKGAPFTTQGDIYALGVLLYQMAVADLERPLALGWERDIADEMLRADIAACVDGDLNRRLRTAVELHTRLSTLDERRQEQATAQRAAAASLRRHRQLRAAGIALVACIVLGGLAVIGFVREHGLRREAQLASADSTLDKGIALHLAGRGQPARDAFIRARGELVELKQSTLAVDVALSRSFREFDAPINTLIGHRNGVMAVAWLPDGVRAVSAGHDSVIRLWDVPSGRVIDTFPGHPGVVLCLAVSRDGLMLSGGRDATVKLWDIAAHKELAPLPPPNFEVRGAAFSPDGRFALWSTVKPSPPEKAPLPSSLPSSASSLPAATVDEPEPTTIATTGSTTTAPIPSGIVYLFDLQTRTMKWTFLPPTREGFYGVAFSPDGRRVLATTYDKAVWVLDAETGQPVRERLRAHDNYVIAGAFAPPQGRQLLSASLDNKLKLWDVEAGRVAEVLEGHTAGVRGVGFVGSDGRRALSCSMDGTLRLWDMNWNAPPPSKPPSRTFAGHSGAVYGMAISPDGRRAISAGGDQSVHVWDLTPNNEVPTAREADIVTALSCSNDGLLLASGDASGHVTLRDRATLRVLGRLSGHDRPVESVSIVTESKQVFAADDAGNAILWDLASVASASSGMIAPVRTFPPPAPGMGDRDRLRSKRWCYTAVAPDGSVAVSSTPARNITVWSLATGKPLRTLGPISYDTTTVAISPDARHALCGDEVGMLYQWDVATGALLFSTRTSLRVAHLDRVVCSADGQFAATAGHDMTTRVWNLAERRKVAEFEDHTDTVRALGFGRDGHTLFSSGKDEALHVRQLPVERTPVDSVGDLHGDSYALAVIPSADAVAVSAGEAIGVWDLSRAPRRINHWSSRIAAARNTLQSNAGDPAALTTMGEWYASCGVHDWAIALFDRARAAGSRDVSSVTLAQCYWRMGRLPEAAAEFRNAMARNEAPAEYLKLCLAATLNPPPPPPPPPPATTTTQPAARTN